MAPEVIKLEKATYASDIWSLACTVVELLTGKPPYANMLAMTAMFKIVEDDMPPFPKGCSPELQHFLQLCFAKDPRQRPSADELFEHSWLRKHWSNHKVSARIVFDKSMRWAADKPIYSKLCELKIAFLSSGGLAASIEGLNLTNKTRRLPIQYRN